MEELQKFYIPVYILDQETESAPWYQLYATMDNYGHVEAKWVVNEDGEILSGELLSVLLDEYQYDYDARIIRRPLVIGTLTKDPDILQALVENLIL